MRKQAEAYLCRALRRPDAQFHSGQWEAIAALLKRKRVLVVQRTGWGKSMVYFLACRLFRDQGSGPALLISPLLSLMRNQMEAARRIGLRCETINSTNQEAWEDVKTALEANEVDLLIISPERLSNTSFQTEVLTPLARSISFLVVDEAHCISDWGHDFRPDYRRIGRILRHMPPRVPVLATTATANNRVVVDIQKQLGRRMTLLRGSLVRRGLKLQNIHMPSAAVRMAWLATVIPFLPGSGIVYTLTQRDAERIASWLQRNGIKAQPYHAGVRSEGEEEIGRREALEQALLKNEIKVLVATVALGMGFDKPDLGFVIHFQRPASVVHYYQQVGRAGRALDNAYGIMLCGEEDGDIAEYFRESAFPPQKHIQQVLTVLKEQGSLAIRQVQRYVNLRFGEIRKALRFLALESPAPVIFLDGKWSLSPAGAAYKVNSGYADQITAQRVREEAQMQDYLEHKGCLMVFLQRALDDKPKDTCGICKNCSQSGLLSDSFDPRLANEAGIFLRRNYQVIEPRLVWPMKDLFVWSPFKGYAIAEDLQASPGRALSLWRDAGWGTLVAEGKYQTRFFSDELVRGCVEMIETWAPQPKPEWICCIPSLRSGQLVPDFAKRLADALQLPFEACLVKVRDTPEQKEMKNSYHQVRNLDGAFRIRGTMPKGPCFLIDDMVSSRWTFTVAAALLRQAGCRNVFPLALALNALRNP